MYDSYNIEHILFQMQQIACLMVHGQPIYSFTCVTKMQFPMQFSNVILVQGLVKEAVNRRLYPVYTWNSHNVRTYKTCVIITDSIVIFSR